MGPASKLLVHNRAPSGLGRRGAATGRQRRDLVGPNAIIQLVEALRVLHGSATMHHVMRSAGLSHYVGAPPAALVPEGEVARLFAATCDELPAGAATQALELAGRLTAAYIASHRIPSLAQAVLRRAPTWLAVRLLLVAIRAHAWTFAGSGRVGISLGRFPALSIEANPLVQPGCPWHTHVIEQLFRTLVSPTIAIVHRNVIVAGQTADRFDLVWSGRH